MTCIRGRRQFVDGCSSVDSDSFCYGEGSGRVLVPILHFLEQIREGSTFTPFIVCGFWCHILPWPLCACFLPFCEAALSQWGVRGVHRALLHSSNGPASYFGLKFPFCQHRQRVPNCKVLCQLEVPLLFSKISWFTVASCLLISNERKVKSICSMSFCFLAWTKLQLPRLKMMCLSIPKSEE